MTDQELQALVEAVSAQYFARPFRHQARFNSRLRTTGGRYLLRSHDIEINPRHLEQHGEEELIGIVKHELCHYHLHLEKKGYQHKDRDFQELLKQVGEVATARRSAAEEPGFRIAMSLCVKPARCGTNESEKSIRPVTAAAVVQESCGCMSWKQRQSSRADGSRRAAAARKSLSGLCARFLACFESRAV